MTASKYSYLIPKLYSTHSPCRLQEEQGSSRQNIDTAQMLLLDLLCSFGSLGTMSSYIQCKHIVNASETQCLVLCHKRACYGMTYTGHLLVPSGKSHCCEILILSDPFHIIMSV